MDSETLVPRTPSGFLWHFVKRQGRFFGPIALCLCFWALNEALYPYFIKLFVNKLVECDPSAQALWPVISGPFWGLISVWILHEIANRTMGILGLFAYPNLRAEMRTYMVNYTKEHSYTYFMNNLGGKIANRIHDVPKSGQSIVERMLDYVFATGLAFSISCAVLFTVSPLFVGIMILWLVGHLGVTFYFMPELRRKSSLYADRVSDLQGETFDVITNFITVRLFAREKAEMRRLKRAQDNEIKQARIADWSYQKVNFCRGILSTVFIVAIIGGLVQAWKRQLISVGDFPLVAMTCFNIMGMVWYLTASLSGLFRDFGTLNAALELIRAPHDRKPGPQAPQLQVTKGAIDIEKIKFKYRHRTYLFHNLSVAIKGGEKVGLVGFSGSGKTTLVNLILSFFPLTGGRILIDGQDITKVDPDSLRSQIAMIPQDPGLFHRSIKENIAYGKLDARDEEIIQAAKLAHAHDFIMQLEEGYNTMVGERGLKLSGGQRQRIAIARAILKDAPLLILDEATSALDSVTENLIQDSLIRAMQGRTTLVIAHRLSTLAEMDRILVFDRGKLLEQGSQEELMAQKGHFYQLWTHQNGGYLIDSV
jgi:ABC-type multidrug transport system, ATPase and permease components